MTTEKLLTEETEDTSEQQIKKLNYVMKCYIDDFEETQKEHEERKKTEIAKMKQHNEDKLVNINKEKEEKKEEEKPLSMSEKIAKAREIHNKISTNTK